MNNYLVVLSGGVGSRFGSKIPKQYSRSVSGISIIYMSVLPFIKAGFKNIYIVCDSTWEDFITNEFKEHKIIISFVEGGKERQDSIDNGINAVTSNNKIGKTDNVYIQESVRPFISDILLNDLMEADPKHLSVTPGINPAVLYGTFDYENKVVGELVPKTNIIELQLPKRHNISSYNENRAMLKKDSIDILDETEVFANVGITTHIVKGDFKNIKVTFPEHRFLLDVY